MPRRASHVDKVRLRRAKSALLWLAWLIAVACSSDNDLNPQPEYPNNSNGFSQVNGKANRAIGVAPEASGGESADP